MNNLQSLAQNHSAFILHHFEDLGKNSPHPREQLPSRNPFFLDKMTHRPFGDPEKPQIRRENVLEQIAEKRKTPENRPCSTTAKKEKMAPE
jgi:hypothetical protein